MGLQQIILAICALTFGLSEAGVITPLVVNGTDTTIEEFAFMVSLRWRGKHDCGGTIINEYWVLTAAHCVIGSAVEDMSVHIVSTYLDVENPVVIFVEDYFVHEYYDASQQYINDIALVKLNAPIQNHLFNWKVKLAPKGAYYATGTPAVLAGWGLNATSGLGGSIQNTLQKANIQVFSWNDCAELHTRPVRSTNICGGVEGGWKGQCNDSGGPLLVNGVQVGIVSWSVKPCQVPPYPGVYTAVSQYIPWIEEKIGSKLSLNAFLIA